MKIRFIGLPPAYSEVEETKRKGRETMGDVLVIIALALYVPMSMVYVLAGKG